MPYSTPESVRLALVPSSKGLIPNPPSNTAADFEDEQLNDAIAEADSTIDSYIGGRYITPVAGTAPHPIDYWSRNLAAYFATLTYRGSQDFADTDPIARRYLATMVTLGAVSKGTTTLNVPANAGDSSVSGAGQPVNQYDGNLFGGSTDGVNLGPRNSTWEDYPTHPGWNW